jgi:hypothetical protein
LPTPTLCCVLIATPSIEVPLARAEEQIHQKQNEEGVINRTAGECRRGRKIPDFIANDRPEQNSPPESEHVRVPHQHRKSMRNPDGWISGPRETSDSGREWRRSAGLAGCREAGAGPAARGGRRTSASAVSGAGSLWAGPLFWAFRAR